MSEFAFQVLLTFDAALRLATPLILCALAGIFSERSGVIDISLEGKLLGSAFAAAAVASVSGSVCLGLLAAVGVSVCMALVHGFACITQRGNQIVSGLALNILASGLTVTLGVAFFERGGQTPALAAAQRFQPIRLPLTETLQDVPLIGVAYGELLSGHKLIVYLPSWRRRWPRCCSPGPASACACARWESRRKRWTAPASRSRGCATGRRPSPASCAASPAPTSPPPTEQGSYGR